MRIVLFGIITITIVLMLVCIMVFLNIMRKRNIPRADGSIPKLGDADLFSYQPLQRKNRQKQSTPKSPSRSTPEEDIFKVPDSTF